MKVSLYANGSRFCEDFEIESEWQPPKRHSKRFMGTINNGYIKLPSTIEGVVGNYYNFEIIFEGESVVELFKGLFLETASGVNYIEIVSDITEEKL